MSAAKHTPGPWEAKPTGPWDGWDGWSVEDALGNVVCDAHGSQSDGAREANARLIAAAPELLEALQDLKALVWGECPSLLNEDSGGNSMLSMLVDAAIAKATGETP